MLSSIPFHSPYVILAHSNIPANIPLAKTRGKIPSVCVTTIAAHGPRLRRHQTEKTTSGQEFTPLVIFPLFSSGLVREIRG